MQPQHREGRAKTQKLSGELVKGETDCFDKSFEKTYCNTAAPHKGYLPLPSLSDSSKSADILPSKVHLCRYRFKYIYIYIYRERAGEPLPNDCPFVIRIIVTFKWSAYLALWCELWQWELSACGYKLARRAGCGLARRAPCQSRPLGGALLRGGTMTCVMLRQVLLRHCNNTQL